MESLPGQRARDRAVRTDDPQVESKLLHDGQGKGVAPPGHHNDFDPCRMGPAQCGHIGRGDLKFGVQQGAVDIDTQKTDGRFH